VRPGRHAAAIIAAVGMLAMASSVSAQAVFRAAELAVYDSAGTKVGTLSKRETIRTQWSVEVVLRTNSGHTVFLDVERSGFLDSGRAKTVYFREADCSGQPFVWAAGPGRTASALIGPRETLYVQTGLIRRLAMQSTLRSDGECHQYFPPAPELEVDERFAAAKRLAIDFADYFTPPFVLRATPGEPIPPGAAADSLEPTDRLVVFDATGKRVVAADANAVVTDSGVTMLMNTIDEWEEDVYFESTDCSGPPFLAQWVGRRLTTTMVIGPRKTVYVHNTDPPTRFTVYSILHGGSVCAPARTVWRGQVTPGILSWWTPAATIGLDLADYFTWPFSVRAGRGTQALPAP
jgi:hypothetical protein